MAGFAAVLAVCDHHPQNRERVIQAGTNDVSVTVRRRGSGVERKAGSGAGNPSASPQSQDASDRDAYSGDENPARFPGIIPSVLAALGMGKRQRELQEMACRVVVALSSASGECGQPRTLLGEVYTIDCAEHVASTAAFQTLFAEAGCVKAIVGVLRHYPLHASAQKHGAEALTALALHNGSFQ